MSLIFDAGASRCSAASLEPSAPAALSPGEAPQPGWSGLEIRGAEPSYHPQLGALQAGRAAAAGGPSFDSQVRGTAPKAIDLQLAELSGDAYNLAGNGVKGWTRLSDAELAQANLQPGLLDDPSTGFRAAIYKDDAGHIVLAFAGTDPKSGKDWLANGEQALGLPAAQYDQAVRVATIAKQAFGDDLVVTGHSLGGGLASVAAVATNTAAVTFNASGVSNGTLQRYVGDADPAQAKQEADNGLVRRYAVKGDVLTGEQESGALSGLLPDAIGHKIELAPAGRVPWPLELPGLNLISDTVEGVKLHLLDSVTSALKQDHPWSPGGPGEGVIDRIVDGTGKVGTSIVGGIDSVKNGAKGIIGGITGTAGDLAGHVPVVGGLLEGAIDGVGSIAKGTVEVAGDIADGAVGVATHLVQGTEKTVGGLIGSIVDGVKAAGSAVTQGAKAAGSAIVDGAKAVGGAVTSGAQAVGHAISSAMPWNW